jgi:hypothetical protein
MEASKEVIAQSEVELEAESTEGDEEKLQEGHNQEAKEVIDKHSEEYCECIKHYLKECYPSLRINIWCYPTSRVFYILVFMLW